MAKQIVVKADVTSLKEIAEYGATLPKGTKLYTEPMYFGGVNFISCWFIKEDEPQSDIEQESPVWEFDIVEMEV